MKPNYNKLEKNMTDVILEQQIKLGYRRESVGLYYMLTSLNRILQTSYEEEQMQHTMEEFAVSVSERFGQVKVTHEKDRFRVTIPSQGSDYVHENQSENDFLVRFIAAISKHQCTLEDIKAVFVAYSPDIFVGKMEDNEDFDYLVYFKNGEPNDYRYCITFEGCHTIYHRFTPEDYVDFGFGEAVEV